jgi:hypothetical protein
MKPDQELAHFVYQPRLKWGGETASPNGFDLAPKVVEVLVGIELGERQIGGVFLQATERQVHQLELGLAHRP